MSKTIQRPLADVLWEAANVYLSAGGSCDDAIEKFSCNAALRATKEPLFCAFDRYNDSKTIIFLRKLGCDFYSTDWGDLDKEIEFEQMQGVRYMWLLLAMHVAEDEGVMVEVVAQ